MARYRWSTEEKKLVRIDGDDEGPRRVMVFGDSHYDGLRATDGTPINSKRRHREYMKAHGVTTTDDFKNEWAAAEMKRQSEKAGNVSPERRREVIRDIVEAVNRHAR